jgi:branched-chain amino acid transport system permease protein
MVNFAQMIVTAITLSALYALVAIGFTMIFGVADILNVAHGAAIILGGFSAFYVTRILGVSIWIGAIAALVIPAAFSILVYKIFVKPIEDDEIFVVIITLVILLFTENFFLVLEGTSPRTIPQLVASNLTIGSVTVQFNRVAMFAISWIVIIALFWLTNRTWLGRGIKGLSMTDRGSALVGVDRERTTIATYALAGSLAGLAGLFFAMSQGVSYDMGLEPLLLAFAIVILGGMGSIKGSVVGAYIVGTLETVTTTMIDSRMTGIVALIIMFLVIIVRPNGLYGRPGGE